MRDSTLDIGDRVLIRNVVLMGKHKLADKWARHPYIVMGQPDKNIPVYKVKRESGKGQEKTLHRNMLLPFSIIPLFSETDDILWQTKILVKLRGEGKQTKCLILIIPQTNLLSPRQNFCSCSYSEASE